MVESLTTGLHQGLLEAGRLDLEKFIQSFEEDVAQIEIDGRVFDRSVSSEKVFLTLLGEINLCRGLYYQRAKDESAQSNGALVPRATRRREPRWCTST